MEPLLVENCLESFRNLPRFSSKSNLSWLNSSSLLGHTVCAKHVTDESDTTSEDPELGGSRAATKKCGESSYQTADSNSGCNCCGSDSNQPAPAPIDRPLDVLREIGHLIVTVGTSHRRYSNGCEAARVLKSEVKISKPILRPDHRIRVRELPLALEV